MSKITNSKYLIFWLFLIGAFFGWFFPNSVYAKSTSILEISPSSFDWGEVPYTTPSKYSVSLKNSGDSDMEIKAIYTSCHCTTAQVILQNGELSPVFGMHSLSSWRGKIFPGQEAKLDITLDPKAHNVIGETRRTIYIETNDAKKPKTEINFRAFVVDKDGNRNKSKFFDVKSGFWKMLPVVSIAALGDSVNPCAIVTLLLFLIFMFSLKKPRKLILLLSVLYILGIFLAYLLIGLGLFKTFHLLGTPHLIAKIMAVLAFILGLAALYEFFFKKNLKLFTIPISIRLKFMDWTKKATMASAFGLGVLVGICEFPCTGGIYLAIVSLLSAKTSYLTGALWLLFYNLVFILPLLLVLVFATRPAVADKILSFEERKSRIFKLIMGILMLLLAVLIWLWVN